MDIDIAYEVDAFTRNLRARGRSDMTIRTYLKAVHQFETYLNGTESVTRATIEQYLVDARHRLSPTTIAQQFRSLQQFFKYVATETDDTSPMEGMSPPTAQLRPPEVLTPDELRRLFATCAGPDFDSRRDLALLSLFADTGVRRGEMAGIRTGDLDLAEQVVVVSGKTGTRGVPYGSETATRLDRYLRIRRRHPAADEPWLWLGRKGRFTVFGIEGVVESRGKKAGLDINPHLFRHTFAHMWLDGGGNEGDLQRLAGWTNGAMLQRYGASAASARARRAYLAGRSPVDKLGTT
jgi:site-specific recombinase XerD